MHAAPTPDLNDMLPVRRRRITPAVEALVLALALAIAVATYFVLTGGASDTRVISPPLVALLLVANLVSGTTLMMLIGRRIARRRAVQSQIGGNGQLHVQLVALFSLVAAVPLVLVNIFASLLFQYGVEFW